MTRYQYLPQSQKLILYPLFSVVSQLTQSLDLNTLHALSRTCRRFRVILLHFRDGLIHQTLRCTNDQDITSSPSSITRSPSRRQKILHNGLPFQDRHKSPSWYAGKTGPCARDMVSDCRLCGVIICRVCRTSSVDLCQRRSQDSWLQKLTSEIELH